MWRLDQILLEIEAVEETTMVVRIDTPIGRIDLMGDVTCIDRVLYIENAHVQGLSPGALGRAGLNSIGRKLLAEADVDKIVIEGSARTTGKNPSRRPRAIRFPH